MRQAVGFRLLTAQAENSGWWDPLPSLSALCHNAFLVPRDLKGSQDIWKTRKEKTLALAKTLQSCSKWSCGPYSMMCGTARDLQGCMASLMWFKRRMSWRSPLLKSVGNMLVMSPTPAEEAALLDEPQEAQVTATCPITCEEQAPEPQSVARLGETATEPQDMWMHPLPPPGFGLSPAVSTST